MGSDELNYCSVVFTSLNSRKHLNFFIRISYSTFFVVLRNIEILVYGDMSAGQNS